MEDLQKAIFPTSDRPAQIVSNYVTTSNKSPSELRTTPDQVPLPENPTVTVKLPKNYHRSSEEAEK